MRLLTTTMLAACLSAGCAAAQQGGSHAEDAIQAVVVTGGHGFEEDPFFAVFEGDRKSVV